MPAYEKTYASLAKSLIDGIVQTSQPSAERALDILTLLQKESNNEMQPMTISILESTKIGRVLRKTVKVCKRRGQTRVSTGANDNWDKAVATAEELLSKFKEAHEAELIQKTSKDKPSKMVAIATPEAEKRQAGLTEITTSEDKASKMVANAIEDIIKATQHDKVRDGKADEGAQEGMGDSDNPTLVSYSEDTLPQSLYTKTQRVYAKDDATGLLYPAFVRKVMWGPTNSNVTMGFCSSLVEGLPCGGIVERDNSRTAAEEDDDEEEDEDARRWGPKQNCWHYYVHYMGWAVKWDRWVEEQFLYDDSVSSQSLAKTLMTEYKKVKPKKRGQKMSSVQVSKWMKKMTELESEHRSLVKKGMLGGKEAETRGNDGTDERKVTTDVKMSENTGYNNGNDDGESNEIMQEHFKQQDDSAITAEKKSKRRSKPVKKKLASDILQMKAQLRESGLQMKRKKSISDQLTLPFNLKKILVEEWEVITKCDMVHNLPSKVSVREALNQYLESKLVPLREKHEKESNGDKKLAAKGGNGKMQVDDASSESCNGNAKLGKEWIDVVEGIALFFDQALPVHLLFAEERGQYASLRRQILAQRRNAAAAACATLSDDGSEAVKAVANPEEVAKQCASPAITDNGTTVSESSAQSSSAKAPPPNFLPERMSEIYGCELLLRLFMRLPSVVAESPTMSQVQSRRIFSKLGDLIRYLQKNQSTLFQPSFRKLLPGEIRRGGKKVVGK